MATTARRAVARQVALSAMPPIRLTDTELEAVFTAAPPLKPCDRDAFLQAIATELVAQPVVGDGVVHRICSEIQRRLFSPPLGVD
jgi:hypothetical protein